MVENRDYELIPNDNDSWDVRILAGDYIETVFGFQALKIVPETDEIKFSVDISYTPDPLLTTDDLEFQKVAGDILFSILDNLSQEQEDQ